MPTSKMGRPEAQENLDQTGLNADYYDFGEPEILSVELRPGLTLALKEPTAEGLIALSKITDDRGVDRITATLEALCFLHHPLDGQPRLTMKSAKKLRPKQLELLGDVVANLLGQKNAEEDKESSDTE